MVRYQNADPQAPAFLVEAISPALLRFFSAEISSRRHAEDLVQDTWLRIHRSRRTWRPEDPLLPWVYAIARHVRVDAYRRRRRIEQRESAAEALPEPAVNAATAKREGLDFETLVSGLPASQREVLIMLKVTGLSLEEVARATSSTVGSVKQKAHRAYERIRKLLKCEEEIH